MFHASISLCDHKFLLLYPISGVGGYSYLLEPLWWIGMITSKFFSFVMHYVILIIVNHLTFIENDKGRK